MTNHIKTAKFATTAAVAVENSDDLHILGPQDLKNTESILSNFQEIPCDYCITKKFSNGENFFYTATQNIEGQLLAQEVGVGSIYSKGRGKSKTSYLRREISILFKNSRSSFRTKGELHDFLTDKKIIIETYIPENINELFVKANSIPCSIAPHTPTLVELDENCLVGRKNDIIQSIDRDELWSILTNEEKWPSNPTKGSIRYNNQDNCFEGYDGQKWRALMWGE